MTGPVEQDKMCIEWDVAIAMDDGVVVRADVFRPSAPGKYPVLLTYGPYAKGLAFQKGYSSAWQNMIAGKFDYGFAVDWMRKDLGIAMAEGKRQKAGMPLVALVDQFYERVQARGGGRWDTSSLIQPLQKP